MLCWLPHVCSLNRKFHSIFGVPCLTMDYSGWASGLMPGRSVRQMIVHRKIRPRGDIEAQPATPSSRILFDPARGSRSRLALVTTVMNSGACPRTCYQGLLRGPPSAIGRLATRTHLECVDRASTLHLKPGCRPFPIDAIGFAPRLNFFMTALGATPFQFIRGVRLPCGGNCSCTYVKQPAAFRTGSIYW